MEKHKGNGAKTRQIGVMSLRRFMEIGETPAAGSSDLKMAGVYFNDTTYRCEKCGRTPAREHRDDEYLCKVHHPNWK